MTDVFIVGSKGIPAQYGGFETFVEQLTARKQSPEIQYHVSCMDNEEKHFEHNGADCFNVKLPLKGAPGRILHVSRVLSQVERWCAEHPDAHAIVYILGCRIGPLLIPHTKKLHRLGVKIFVNPDGLEWKRDKWNAAAKKFLRYCESCLVRYSDLAICDSKTIEQYIKDTYGDQVKATTYIAYGADVVRSTCSEEKLQQWYDKFGLQKDGYYLIVGRFVPENNYETMLTEFMRSGTKRDLVIVTNVEHNKFYRQLATKTGFKQDPRIKFVGTVYDQELLKKIREEAHAYLHGHEVGGTNPSLLEALASTKVNLLLDVGFNREVAEDRALYWEKSDHHLASILNEADALKPLQIAQLEKDAKTHMREEFSWEQICKKYEGVWRAASNELEKGMAYAELVAL